MTVHLYKVLAPVAPLREALEFIQQCAVADRNRDTSHYEMRLEAAAPPRSGRAFGKFWLLDFTKLRFDHGPGRVKRTAPIRSFHLAEDEGFGEETAALYDPLTEHIVIQYNHNGPRASAIAEYLSLCEPDIDRNFEFLPKLDGNVQVKFAKQGILKKLTFRIAAPSPTSAMREAGVSVGRAIDLSDEVGAHSIDVTLSAGRGKLHDNRVRHIVNNLLRFRDNDRRHDSNELSALRVHGKVDEVSPIEELDFLVPKISMEIDGIQRDDGLRYTRDSRWSALLRARNGWSSEVRK